MIDKVSSRRTQQICSDWTGTIHNVASADIYQVHVTNPRTWTRTLHVRRGLPGERIRQAGKSQNFADSPHYRYLYSSLELKSEEVSEVAVESPSSRGPSSRVFWR